MNVIFYFALIPIVFALISISYRIKELNQSLEKLIKNQEERK